MSHIFTDCFNQLFLNLHIIFNFVHDLFTSPSISIMIFPPINDCSNHQFIIKLTLYSFSFSLTAAVLLLQALLVPAASFSAAACCSSVTAARSMQLIIRL
jgi:hypothetical protein